MHDRVETRDAIHVIRIPYTHFTMFNAMNSTLWIRTTRKFGFLAIRLNEQTKPTQTISVKIINALSCELYNFSSR